MDAGSDHYVRESRKQTRIYDDIAIESNAPERRINLEVLVSQFITFMVCCIQRHFKKASFNYQDIRHR